MDMSTYLLRWLGVLLLSIVGTAGCAEFGAENAALPTAPSSLSAGSSASLSQSSVVTLAAGPGASYDATGSWHVEVIDLRTPNTVAESFDTFLNQDADGNISFLNNYGVPVALTRRGTGLIVTYAVSVFADSSPCDFKLSGTARLDTRTNKGSASVVGTENDCTHIAQVATITKH